MYILCLNGNVYKKVFKMEICIYNIFFDNQCFWEESFVREEEFEGIQVGCVDLEEVV